MTAFRIRCAIPNLLFSPLNQGEQCARRQSFKKARGTHVRYPDREKVWKREVGNSKQTFLPLFLSLELPSAGTRRQEWLPQIKTDKWTSMFSLALRFLAKLSKSGEQNKGQSPPTVWKVREFSPGKMRFSLYLTLTYHGLPGFLSPYRALSREPFSLAEV